MRPVAHPPTPGWKAEGIETLRLAGPLALANLLQMLTYAIDVIFIARLGADELAASALAVALFGLVLWSLQSLTGAVAPIMAAEIGARGPALRPVRRAVRMALWLSLLVSVVGMGVCLLIGPLMQVTGQEPQIAALATDYMWVLVWSCPLMIVAGVQRNFVAALGRPHVRHADHGAGHRRECAGQLRLHLRQSGRAANGPAGCGDRDIHHVGCDCRHVCSGHPRRSVPASLSHHGLLLAARLARALARLSASGRPSASPCWPRRACSARRRS